MNGQEWATFFYLLNRIINMPGLTANEKMAAFATKAAEHEAATNCRELAAYIDEAGI